MFCGVTDKRRPGDFRSGVADREKRNSRAEVLQGGRVGWNGPHEAAWWKRLQREATARVRMRSEGTLVARHKSPAAGERSVKLLPQGIDQWISSIAVLCLLLVAAGAPLSAAPSGGPAGVSALELVKNVVRNETRAREHPQNYYKFVQKETTPQGSKTSIRIETPHGEIGVPVTVNGKPPSQRQCSKDVDSLKKLAADSQTQQRQAQEQKEQNDRIDKLMEAIPQAFVFRYKENPQDGALKEITFRPNPRFQPQSRETALLKGMQGTLWADPESQRLVKIEGTLINSVNFGWGFLASVHAGGHFALQQSRIAGGSWKATYLKVDLDGSKLIFGQLHVHFNDSSRSYVPLPKPPSIAEAVDMLEHSTTACREGKSQSTTAQAQM
ncbi:MAG TPA: hypothetical protein VFL79_12245 [Terriglobia bacterium]|nr:hypothetical protein [Terriglobia bacterium]